MLLDSRLTMLRFIQLLPTVPYTGDFLLRDLPGSGRRVDILCRDLAACFDWGPTEWPLTQLELKAIFSDQVILTFQKPNEKMPKGEREWAMVIKNALQGNPPDYVSVTEGNLESIIRELGQSPLSQLWVLHEKGEYFGNCHMHIFGTQNSFMLGDYKGFDSRTEELIVKHGLMRVALGRTSYLSSHCVASVISKFERIVQS